MHAIAQGKEKATEGQQGSGEEERSACQLECLEKGITRPAFPVKNDAPKNA